MSQPHIYILTGLGADKTVFHKLRLDAFNHTFIDWQMPTKDMSLEAYASLMAKQIVFENAVLVGLSFGGIVAIEIAKQIPVKKVVLLATVKTKYELSPFQRLLGKTKLDKIVPKKMFTKVGPLAPYFFGLISKEDKQILSKILGKSSADFMRWAIAKIIRWENTTLVENYIHLHGNKDRLFSARYIKNYKKIEGAGHLITLTHSQVINQQLAELYP